jgi:Protein of unknown function (DUF3592)
MTTTPKIVDRNERKKRQSLAFGRNLIVLAGLIFVPGAWAAAKGALTLRWPRADAKIVDASLRLQTVQSSSRSDTRPDEWSSFIVHYTYSIGGKLYWSGRAEPYDFGMQNSAGAKRMAGRHPTGSSARIAYDPENPAIAYLEPGPSSMSLAMVGIGTVIGLSGLWVRNLARRGIGEMET